MTNNIYLHNMQFKFKGIPSDPNDDQLFCDFEITSLSIQISNGQRLASVYFN